MSGLGLATRQAICHILFLTTMPLADLWAHEMPQPPPEPARLTLSGQTDRRSRGLREQNGRSWKSAFGLRCAQKRLQVIESSENAIQGTLAEQVSRVSFGEWAEAAKGRDVRSQSSVMATAEDGSITSLPLHQHLRSQLTRFVNYGVTSHIESSRTALPKFLKQKPSLSIIGSYIFDDTDVWLAAEPASGGRDQAVAAHGGPTNKKGAKKGEKRVRRTMLGLKVFVHLRRADLTDEQIELFCPGQVLKKANWSTIRHRMAHWCPFTSLGLGGNWDSPQMREALLQIPVKVALLTTDALSANHALVASFEAKQREMLERDDTLSKTLLMLAIDCMHHQCCLAKRPTVLASGASAGLVRLGHLAESANFRMLFREALVAVVTKKFQRKEVFRLPAETGEWRKQNTDLINIFAHGVGPELQVRFLSFFNHCWNPDLNQVFHWCDTACLCESDADSLQTAIGLISEMFGSFFDTPLLYRWKGFEEAACWVIRAKCFATVVLDILRILVESGGDISEDMLNQLDEFDADIAPGTKQLIRAHKTLDLMLNQVLGVKLAITMFATQPLADFMQSVSYCDSVTQRHLFDSGAKSKYAQSETYEKAKELNLGFITGKRGSQVVSEYATRIQGRLSSALNLASLVGTELDTSLLTLYFQCLLSAMAGAWRRLVLPFLGFPWKVFQVLLSADPLVAFSDLISQSERKLCCLEGFAMNVFRFVRTSILSPQQMIALLGDIAANLRISSVIVERLHVTNKAGTSKTGNARHPTTIQKQTYCSSVRLAHKQARTTIEEMCCGISGTKKMRHLLARRVVHQTAPGGSLSKPSKAKAKTKAERVHRLVNKKTRANSGWNSFIARHGKLQGVKVGSPQHRAEVSRLSNMFKQLTKIEKESYIQEADKTTKDRSEFAEKGLRVVSAEASAELSSSQQKRLGQRLLNTSLRQIETHPFWNSGLQLWSSSEALRPGLVNVSMSGTRLILGFLWGEAVTDIAPHMPSTLPSPLTLAPISPPTSSTAKTIVMQRSSALRSSSFRLIVDCVSFVRSHVLLMFWERHFTQHILHEE